jgi:putative NADPH-quinone reductase
VRVLLVLAHPLPNSLCATLAQTARDQLSAPELRFVDLYAQDFDPRLSAAERSTYYRPRDSEFLAQDCADLAWAEVLVLVFPTWWFGFPAILKGWFDRVWAPGVAFDHAADLSSITAKLKLKRVVAITTLGSPWWADLALFYPVRRVLKYAILRACAPQAKLSWISIYKAEKLSQQQVDAAKARVIRALSFRE